MQEASNVNTEKNRKIGLMITLALCALGTVITLVMFSREGFHQRADELFKWLVERLAEFFNNGYGGYIILAGALVVPLGTLFLLPAIDALARCAPAGSFLLDRVGLYFGNCCGIRFLPAFSVSVYFIIAGFMRSGDKTMDFDPESYNPFAPHGAGEWLNIVFMALTIFALLVVIAEGVIAAGPWGMIIHIPLVLAANVYFVALVTAIMAVAANLFGIIFAAVAMSIIAPFFIILLLFAVRRT